MTTPEVTFKYGNWMMVDGAMMTPERYSPDDFADTLHFARGAMIKAIDTLYHRELKRATNPVSVQRPSLFALNLTELSESDSKVLPEAEEPYSGIYLVRSQMTGLILDYWDVVADTGMFPEIRRTSFDFTAALAVRDTPYKT